MSSSLINGLNNSYLQSILGSALQGTGNTSSGVNSTSSQQPDNSQLSPFAQLLSALQQLQESNPTEYQQVTEQISTNLQTAAKTATTDGNSAAATELTQLATDFTNASQTGQLPNISDLAQAVGGGGNHHHHHAHHASSSDSSSSSSSSNPLAQLLAAFESKATQNESLNPLSIITNTLASAGITNS